MDNGLFRDDSPPKSGGVLELFKVRPGALTTFTIVSPTWEGWWIHWAEKKTWPCQNDRKLCPRCLTEQPIKWRGYIHVWQPHSKNRGVLLELTAKATEGLLVLKQDRKDLRGLKISVRRRDANMRSPLCFDLCGETPSHEQLPKTQSALPTLQRFWGIK